MFCSSVYSADRRTQASYMVVYPKKKLPAVAIKNLVKLRVCELKIVLGNFCFNDALIWPLSVVLIPLIYTWIKEWSPWFIELHFSFLVFVKLFKAPTTFNNGFSKESVFVSSKIIEAVTTLMCLNSYFFMRLWPPSSDPKKKTWKRLTDKEFRKRSQKWSILKTHCFETLLFVCGQVKTRKCEWNLNLNYSMKIELPVLLCDLTIHRLLICSWYAFTLLSSNKDSCMRWEFCCCRCCCVNRINSPLLIIWNYW